MKIKVKVNNVGHGLCISLIHENGKVMLWDCGHNEDCRPSVFLPRSGISEIGIFFVTNYDEDHISDLPELRRKLHISTLHRNRSISKEQLISLKRQSGPISPAMASMLDMLDKYTHTPVKPPEFPGVTYSCYRNDYETDFVDSNNISLVTFLTCNGHKFIIPGDLEKPGWEKLLNNTDFCQELQGVKIFIASHHGRENGYCEKVFEHCCPDVVVFSDEPIKHETQKMSEIYARHARGIQFGGKTRHVLSTRQDGTLEWDL
ncbi:ComEC/Rec2 family competence protein [Thiolapillus sp.]|uniref:ComEC/Rec2 family competence protein n=2 Tax=Thiolapillus sp. TaxID=2017437 RepID=UPI003AF57FAD